MPEIDETMARNIIWGEISKLLVTRSCPACGKVSYMIRTEATPESAGSIKFRCLNCLGLLEEKISFTKVETNPPLPPPLRR